MFKVVVFLCIQSVISFDPFEGWGHNNVHCRDNYNQPVEWWFIYKPPKHVSSWIESGRNFTRLTPRSEGRWEESEVFIGATSMLQYTLEPMYKRTFQNHLAVMVYNSSSREVNWRSKRRKRMKVDGSTNGVLMTDAMGGIWLSHSVPDFPNINDVRPSFPQEAYKDGHLLSCFSINMTQLNRLGGFIRKLDPEISHLRIPSYFKNLLDYWSGDKFDKLFTERDMVIYTRVTRTPIIVSLKMPSETECLYETFAKQNKLMLDVYGDHKKGPICKRDYGLRNIDIISLKTADVVRYIEGNRDKFHFAVSTAAHWQRTGSSGLAHYYTCSSNLNKGDTLGNGGMLTCIDNYKIWLGFDNFKVKEPECPSEIPRKLRNSRQKSKNYQGQLLIRYL